MLWAFQQPALTRRVRPLALGFNLTNHSPDFDIWSLEAAAVGMSRKDQEVTPCLRHDSLNFPGTRSP